MPQVHIQGDQLPIEIVSNITGEVLYIADSVGKAARESGVTNHVVQSRLIKKLQRKGPAVYSSRWCQEVVFRYQGKKTPRERRLRKLTPEELAEIKHRNNGSNVQSVLQDHIRGTQRQDRPTGN